MASDGEGRNSPYSTALLAHLEEPGLEIGLMFRKVRDTVLSETGGRQEPFVYGSLSSKGFYLSALPEPASPVTPDVGTGSIATSNEQLFWQSVQRESGPGRPRGVSGEVSGGRLCGARAQPSRMAVGP